MKTGTGAMALAGCLVAAAACGGGGRPIAVVRPVEPFHTVEVAGPLRVSVGGRDGEVRLGGAGEAVRGAVVEVADGVLAVRPGGGGDGAGAVAARIGTPVLRRIVVTGDADVELDLGEEPRARLELVVSGAGRVAVRGVDAELLRVEVAGAARVEVAGRAGRLEVVAAGAGDLDLGGLCAETADADLCGAGRVTVVASTRIDARIEGAALLRYFAPHELPAPAGPGKIRRLPDAGACQR